MFTPSLSKLSAMRRIQSIGVIGVAAAICLATLSPVQATPRPTMTGALQSYSDDGQPALRQVPPVTLRKTSGRLPNGSNFTLPPVGQAPYPHTGASPGLPGSLAVPGALEPTPSYVPQTSCDPVAKKGVKDFKRLVMATYPSGRDWGSVRDCSADGTSEHLEGRAWDWNVDVNNPTQFAQAGQLLTWLTAEGGVNARGLGIMYIVYNHRIWAAYRASEGWRKLGNSNPHTDHVHFSFTWNGARKKTTFWTGRVKREDYGPCRTYQGQPATLRAGKNSSPCPPARQLPSAWRSAQLLWRGSAGPLVSTAQSKLGVSPTSGSFGASTARAAADYQRRNDLPTTGAVDAQTWFALGMGEPTSKAKRKLKKGMKGKDVKRLQRALQMKKKQRNGRYRSSTAKAVTSWKRANGLRPNARASVGFQRKLGL
jgi:hypothetical protein